MTLIEVVLRCPIDKFPEQADVFVLSYIVKSMKHKYQQLSEARVKSQTENLIEEDRIPEEEFMHQIELHVQLKEWLSYLTSQQRKIIVAHYLYDFSDAEIGKRMRISRQAVYQCRSRALTILRELAERK